jgi:hypothetical protein
MNIETKRLRETLLWLVDLIYRARTGLVAYQVAHAFLIAEGLSKEFDLLLAKSQQNPSPALLAEHQGARDTVERLLTEETPDAALEFLRNWKSTGPIQ